MQPNISYSSQWESNHHFNYFQQTGFCYFQTEVARQKFYSEKKRKKAEGENTKVYPFSNKTAPSRRNSQPVTVFAVD